MLIKLFPDSSYDLNFREKREEMRRLNMSQFGRLLHFNFMKLTKSLLFLIAILVVLLFGLWAYSKSKTSFDYKLTEKQLPAMPEEFQPPGTYHFNDILMAPEEPPSKLLYLVLVSSSAKQKKNRDRREAIRCTWAHCLDKDFNRTLLNQDETWKFERVKHDLNIYSGCRVFFYVGITGDDRQDKEIREEALVNKDIIVVDVHESYRNITWKLRSAVKFAANFDAKYILKTDDDVYVHLPRLTKYIANGPGFVTTIYGGTTYTGKVVRDPTHRHFVAKLDYSETNYPLFCKGSMVLLSGSLLPRVVNAFSHVKPFNIDDAYLGIVLKKVGILPIRLEKLVQFQHLRVFLDYLHACDFSWLVGVGDGLDAAKIYSVHKSMIQGGNLPLWMCLHFNWFPLMCVILILIIFAVLFQLSSGDKLRGLKGG